MPVKSTNCWEGCVNSLSGKSYSIIENKTPTDVMVFVTQTEVSMRTKYTFTAGIGGSAEEEEEEEDEDDQGETGGDAVGELLETTVAGAAGALVESAGLEYSKENETEKVMGGKAAQKAIAAGASTQFEVEEDFYLTIASPVAHYNGMHHDGKTQGRKGYALHIANDFVRKGQDYEIKNSDLGDLNYIPFEAWSQFQETLG